MLRVVYNNDPSSCRVPRTYATDRHGQAHNVFFAHARTPKHTTSDNSLNVQYSDITNNYVTEL